MCSAIFQFQISFLLCDIHIKVGQWEQGKKWREERERRRDRHLPKIQGGLPGGRFFLTSMFCFIKAANWAGMNWKKSRKGKMKEEKRQRMRREYFSHVPSCPLRCHDVIISNCICNQYLTYHQCLPSKIQQKLRWMTHCNKFTWTSVESCVHTGTKITAHVQVNVNTLVDKCVVVN